MDLIQLNKLQENIIELAIRTENYYYKDQNNDSKKQLEGKLTEVLESLNQSQNHLKNRELDVE